MQGLEGVKVLELGNMVSAAYATKLMADLGADVIKVEEPGGDLARRRGPFPGGVVDPEKSGLFLYLNTNKRGVSFNLREQREKLLALGAWADVLVHNYPPAQMTVLGIDYEQFRALNPRLVMCSVTPFGLTGPYRDYKAYELNLTNGGGWAWLSPGASDQPDQPPLKAAGQQADFQSALCAATVSLAAYYHALETGVGQHIDLSVQSYIASFLEQNFIYYTYMGRIASRLGRRQLYPWGIFQCRDGLIFLLAVEEDQWRRLVELMGNPEWASWEIFQDQVNRSRNYDALKIYLEEWLQHWNVEDLWRAGQARRICFAPVFTMAQMARQEQLHARNFFVDVVHPRAGKLTHLGPPYRLEEPWWRIRRPAPLLGEHNQEVFRTLPSTQHATRNTQSSALSARLPLEGIRVADFTWVWAGPYCTMHLAHLGAEVIKIESQGRVDVTRRLPLYPKGMKGGVNRSGLFNQWSLGKKSILLNFDKPEALALAKELIKKSDVVVDNFATGVMERLGLSYEELKKIKPDLIVASITGYGHTGPQKDYMGYGPAMAPLSGMSAMTGYAGGPPEEIGLSLGDPNGGINAAVAICAALAARKRTGKGQCIDVSMWEAMTALVPEGWMEYAMNGSEVPRDGNHDPWMVPHNCFRCQGEDEWVSIACGSDEEWQALCRAIGQPRLAADARFRTAKDRKANEGELEQILTSWTIMRDKWEVTRLLQAAGVAAFPSMNSKDLTEDPHLNARGFFAKLPHPEVGEKIHTGIPWIFTNAPNGVRAPAPLLGQHTDEVMREVLGYSEQDIARLKEEKVLY
ncbi:MAG TPA: CoA transferase [Methylomirabilota bacterium]|jgi:crotonobetainyl-CoA:carnitine CoA-transferase CaiB-like acyl-CoA transferase|nr:CoA transferase [Methylomirabilota bacterium]